MECFHLDIKLNQMTYLLASIPGRLVKSSLSKATFLAKFDPTVRFKGQRLKVRLG